VLGDHAEHEEPQLAVVEWAAAAAEAAVAMVAAEAGGFGFGVGEAAVWTAWVSVSHEADIGFDISGVKSSRDISSFRA
jgi:hypothetical protein